MRLQKSCARELTVFIQTNYFRKDLAQHIQSRTIELPVATNSTIEICKYADAALRSIFKQGYAYKKAGVIVDKFVPEMNVQAGLFDNIDRERHRIIMQMMDEINRIYGKDTIKLAAQVYEKRWKMKQQKLSPCYTTRWSDIISIVV